MLVTQVYELTNEITQEILGEEVIVAEDLSNVVDIGTALSNLSNGYDNFIRKLHDKIGKTVFVNRIYKGRAPEVLMDGWEYGAILEKIRSTSLPEAEENEAWTLQNGESVDPFVVTTPDVSAKFYNKRVTFDIPITTTKEQMKSAFRDATQLNAFYSMVQTNLENSLTVKIDELIMRVINAGIGETLYKDFPSANYSAGSTNRAVNVLYLYNQAHPDATLTTTTLWESADFWRFFANIKKNYEDRIKVMSTLFNVNSTPKFTPADRMKVCTLSQAKRAMETYLFDGANQYSTKYLDDIERDESIVYWQGSGIDYDIDETSAIKITTPSGHEVNAGGILSVMFDREALGVSNVKRDVETIYNPKGQYWNEWHKFFAGYFLDLDENFVVFYVA